MTLRTTTIAIVVVAASLSVVIGLPALLRRSHQTEAIRELSRLAKAAAIYYVKPRGLEDGSRMPCQFPPGEIRTHLATSCCDPRVGDGAGQCDPAKIEWNRTLWNGLHFSQHEPHAFIYAYEAAGQLAQARFTASAYGDLDCDGVYSTFRFVGRGDPQSTPTDCILTEAAQFEAIRPDE